MLLALADNVEPLAIDILRRHDDVSLALGAPQSALIAERELVPIEVELVGIAYLPELFDRLPSASKLTLTVVNGIVDGEMAARLEDAGISYFDAAGHSWLWNRDRTKRAATPAHRSRRALYGPSIKLAQLLADHPGEPWSERGLANCGHTTQATAHRLLSRLEEEGLVEREGRGRASVRWVRDPLLMRRWLASEARPTRAVLLSCFVSDPFDLPTVVGRNFAITGAVAAARLGLPVTTERSRPLVRVNVAEDELEDIPQALRGFRTEEGANLTLIADPHRLAFVDSRRPQAPDGLIAPPSRIMLDLYLEPRGEAAVEVFLDLWGDQELS